jgi:hypothetical protein
MFCRPAPRSPSSTVVAYGGTVRVHLDASCCQGQAMLPADGPVPAGLERQARLAAPNCPEYVITIRESS